MPDGTCIQFPLAENVQDMGSCVCLLRGAIKLYLKKRKTGRISAMLEEEEKRERNANTSINVLASIKARAKTSARARATQRQKLEP